MGFQRVREFEAEAFLLRASAGHLVLVTDTSACSTAFDDDCC
jgi:hypothetical protein